MSRLVNCEIHGSVGAGVICAHALEAYTAKRPQPFSWTDANAPEPCGWCRDYEGRHEAAGNDWVGAAEEHLNAKLVCEYCFRNIIEFNGYT